MEYIGRKLTCINSESECIIASSSSPEFVPDLAAAGLSDMCSRHKEYSWLCGKNEIACNVKYY
jgi:hypothetical protein